MAGATPASAASATVPAAISTADFGSTLGETITPVRIARRPAASDAPPTAKNPPAIAPISPILPQRIVQFGVGTCQQCNGKQRRVDRAGLADGKRSCWDAGRHLHDRVERILTRKMT